MQNKRPRPGGRSERIRKAVAQAVLQLIRDHGIDFEIQEVSRLSGVGRATVFRRWPDRASLIGEALSEHVSGFSVTLKGEWPDDLLRMTRDFREFMRDPVELAMNRALLLTNNNAFRDQMSDYWKPIIELFQKPLRDAIDRGEIDPGVDVEIVIVAISEVLVMESLFENFGEVDISERLVSQLVRGCPPANRE
ncbi:TetR-like C-terminal domain-containing protein [Sphingobium estronivorans]|uniref:TetR-like C-terminal domain-containing protein n=1 Tax=Sphingobium estronivorans TaxID=1577690 RepID=UPI001239DDFB|nr:TetR-like C-terminal domain-containing protein [Sphingobium estronivorans]